MEALSKNLERIITSAVKAYTEKIVELCEQHGLDLDVEDFMCLWSDSDVSKTTPPVKDSSKSTSSKTSRKSSNGEGCPYQYSKGDKKGTVCGVKPKAGGDFCSAHEKYKDKEPKEKKVIPQPKKTSLMLVVDKKIGKPVHQESGLVFQSTEERVVIGRLVDKKVQPIDDEVVELAKKYGFPMSKVEDEEKPAKTKKGKAKKEEEDEEKPAKDAKVSNAPKKGKAKKEEEDEEKPAKDAKVSKKGKAKEPEPELEDEEDAPAKRVEASKKGKAKKESDDEELETPTRAPAERAGASKKKTPDAPKKSRKQSEDSLDDAIKDLDDEKVVSKALGLADDDSDEEVVADD